MSTVQPEKETSVVWQEASIKRSNDLIDNLRERFVGKEVYIHYREGMAEGKLLGVLTTNSELALDLGDVILPWLQICSIELKDN